MPPSVHYRNILGIGLRNSHVVVPHSQCLGSDLAEYGFCALSKFGTRHQHAHGAVRTGLDANERIQIALAGTGKTSAMQKSSYADPFFLTGA